MSQRGGVPLPNQLASKSLRVWAMTLRPRAEDVTPLPTLFNYQRLPKALPVSHLSCYCGAVCREARWIHAFRLYIEVFKEFLATFRCQS